MILEKNQCVLCDSPAQQMELADILAENGYKMFAPQFDLHQDMGESWHGFRWNGGYDFPECIASISEDQKERILRGERQDRRIFEYCWFEDFRSLVCYGANVAVEDLL